jgi:hypothetical protein
VVPILDAVLNTDVILILQTDANMNRFSFGFIDELYALIKDGGEAEIKKQQAIREIAERIRQSESYMESIREKAIKRGVTTEEMLMLDAGWIYKNKQNEIMP